MKNIIIFYSNHLYPSVPPLDMSLVIHIDGLFFTYGVECWGS